MNSNNQLFQLRDGTELHMFLVRQPGDAAQRAPTLLYFHGNAGNIGHRWKSVQLPPENSELTNYCRLQNVKGLYSALGCNVALLEYRGYGRSEGSPSEVGRKQQQHRSSAVLGLESLFAGRTLHGRPSGLGLFAH